MALSFSIGAMFVLLAAFWLIGAVAGGIWWRYGVEARDVSLEELTRKEPVTVVGEPTT